MGYPYPDHQYLKHVRDLLHLDELLKQKRIDRRDYAILYQQVIARDHPHIIQKQEDTPMASPDVVASTALKIRAVVGEGTNNLPDITLAMLLDAMPEHSLGTIAEGIDWLREGGFKIKPSDWEDTIGADRVRVPGWYMVRQPTEDETGDWRPMHWNGKAWIDSGSGITSRRRGFPLTGFDMEICETILPVPAEGEVKPKKKKDKK